jgi:hypothetical protein
VKTVGRIAAVVFGVLALSVPAAFAQTPDYPGGAPPQVAGVELVRGETQGGLALTGADIAGIIVVGFGAIALGAVLVRSARRRTA